MKRIKHNFGIVTSPFLLSAGVPPLSNLIDILSSFSNELHVITGYAGIELSAGNSTYIYIIEDEQEKNRLIKILRYSYANLKISYMLAKLSNVDSWFFFMGEGPLFMPIFVAKLFGKNIIFVSSGSMMRFTDSQANSIETKITSFLEALNHILADRIVVYSKRLVSERDWEKYKNKICIIHGLFLDFEELKINKPINERNDLIGYVGRFSEEKGVLNFIKALPEILKTREKIEILVGGDGPLKNEIENILRKEKLSEKVTLTGWITRNKLPSVLNNLKLIIIPSYTEAGPIIALEAMACGIPILATSVGLIPDIIKNQETGFILENNSPECIAENIIKVLDNPNLDKIVMQARELVETEFTYDAAVMRYKKLLERP